MIGNECTGDITKVAAFLDTIEEHGDNWIHGTKGKFKICAKVFATPSSYGIKDGRISKLQVCDISQEHWGFDACYLNYSRGWDMRPKDAPEQEFLNGLLEAFGDDPLDGDDLLWYDLYGYDTQEDFDNCDPEHIMSMDTKAGALDEASYYTTEDYVKIKIRCSDDEADEDVIIECPEPEEKS